MAPDETPEFEFDLVYWRKMWPVGDPHCPKPVPEGWELVCTVCQVDEVWLLIKRSMQERERNK